MTSFVVVPKSTLRNRIRDWVWLNHECITVSGTGRSSTADKNGVPAPVSTKHTDILPAATATVTTSTTYTFDTSVTFTVLQKLTST